MEFKMAVAGRRPVLKPKVDPVATAERRRQNRAARKARNLALAHYIDALVRSGEVADLADVARMCGVSRARVSKIMEVYGLSFVEQERLLVITLPQ